jgi:hypothetical protein
VQPSWSEGGTTRHNFGRGPKNRKRGDEIKKKSSLKLLSQSQPNFAEMILVWSPSKIVSGISDQFWKGAIQEPFHQSLVLIELLVPDDGFYVKNSHKNLLVWNQLLNWNQPLIK